MQFTLTITLGNVAMSTSEDLSFALRQVAKRIRDKDYVKHIRDEGGSASLTRGVVDENGNCVGAFGLTNNDE